MARCYQAVRHHLPGCMFQNLCANNPISDTSVCLSVFLSVLHVCPLRAISWVAGCVDEQCRCRNCKLAGVRCLNGVCCHAPTACGCVDMTGHCCPGGWKSPCQKLGLACLSCVPVAPLHVGLPAMHDERLHCIQGCLSWANRGSAGACGYRPVCTMCDDVAS